MVGGQPDETLFRETLTAVMDRASEGGRRMRVYGEMVALLWDDGDVRSALALEDLWNNLAKVREFALLCAYPMRAFEGRGSGPAFKRVCEQHSQVIPSEGYTLLEDPAVRSVAVAQLQQQTAALRAELELRESEERFRLMVEGVENYAILMLDAEGRVASWNAGAQHIEGYGSEAIIGQAFSVFYPPEDVAAGKPERDLAIAARDGRLESEGWRLRRNGDRFWASVLITALRHGDGTLRGFGTITRDLTDRHAAELALQDSEQRFRRAFDEARIGMMIIGLDGHYQRVNDAFCAMVGYRHGQLAGFSSASITHPDDVADDDAALRSLLEGKEASLKGEKRYLHASGHVVWAAINLTMIRDASGQPLHMIAQVEDITKRLDHERRLEYMAHHDPLTGLLNRRSFESELNGYAARATRYGATGTLMMIDLDNFKSINDTQGHSAGDRLMVVVAHGLQSRLRESDVLGRLGGDEFAVLLPGVDERATGTVAETLLEVVRAESMPALIGDHPRVTASIGIARFDDGERLTPQELLANADLAMYDAKEAGGDRWARFRPEEHHRPRNEGRVPRDQQIEDAVAHHRFAVFAQPIVLLAGDGPPQYELLLRVHDRDGDLIPPGSFVYVAERLGLRPLCRPPVEARVRIGP